MKIAYLRQLLALVLVLAALPIAAALESSYCLTSEITDISPTSIETGEEFTVGVQIENCGALIPDFVYFELLQPPADITIQEPLKINISKFYYGNSERFITYHMRTNDDADPGAHVIKTRLTYGEKDFSLIETNSINFEVIGEKAELSVASVKTKPVLPYEGDTVELTMRIENSGKGTAKTVKVYANHPFQGVKQSFVGALGPDEDGSAVFTFIADKPGEFAFPLMINYSDDFGEKEMNTMMNLSVLKKESDHWIIIVSAVTAFVIAVLIFFLIRTKRTKDKIIQQLLKGNNSIEKTRRTRR